MSDDNKEGAGVPAIECDICQGNSALCDPHDCGDAHHPAVMPAAPSDAVRPCEYCDDTGDVHGLDGEWRGVCICPAGAALSQTMQPQAAAGEQAGAVADELLAFVKKIANGEVQDHMFSSLEDEASSLSFRAAALLALTRKS